MPKPLTVSEVAERYGVSESLVYAWIEEGRLKCLRFGRKGRRGTIRVTDDQLEAFVEGCKAELED